jgi:energy-coupling factor transport system permease protein
MSAFVWHETDSFLHRLNPLTKLGLCIPVTILVSSAREPTTPLTVAILALLATRVLGHVPWSVLVRPLLYSLVFAFGLFWTYGLFYTGPGSSWVYGLAMGLRLVAIFMTSTLFVVTSDPTEFVRALIHQLHVPPRIAYSIFAGYRFVPLVQADLENVRAAYQVRGASRFEFMTRLPISLLAQAVRRGERVALAMESRAFGALSQRTYFKVTTLGWRDAAFSVCALLVLALLGLRLTTL